MEVAMEMVNELDLIDWEPGEIAEVIEEEISALIPGWKDSGSPEVLRQHSFDYDEDDDENHPPHVSCSPSNESLRGISDSSVALFCHERALDLNHDWLQGKIETGAQIQCWCTNHTFHRDNIFNMYTLNRIDR